MNVLRSLARDVFRTFSTDASRASPDTAARTLNAVRQHRVPAVLGLSRFRDGFEQLPQHTAGALRTPHLSAFRPAVTPARLQRDGFEGGRRAPVDLSGGVKHVFAKQAEAAPAMAAGFQSSLAELAALL